MNDKEIANAKGNDKKQNADDTECSVDLFEKLPEDIQDAILELMRTMVKQNG